MTAQESEDRVFQQRLHAQIRSDLEPAVRRARQDLLEKMKQARDDKPKKQQFMAEYNEALRAVEEAGTKRFNEELGSERARRRLMGDWGDQRYADRPPSRIGDFAGAFSGQSGSPEWSTDSFGQRGATPGLGHNRSRSSLGNHASLLNNNNIRPASSRAMYSGAGSSPSGRPNNSFDETLDEARIRKFKEDQARAERAHSPAIPIPGVADQAMKKFADEQARLHRAHSPEIPRNGNDAHSKFAEEQARLHRAHSPELPRKVSQTKFAEEQARLNRTHSPDLSRSDTHWSAIAEEQRALLAAISADRDREKSARAAQTPTGSTEAAEMAAFKLREQEIRARRTEQEAARNTSSSRMGQNAKPAPAPHVPTAKPTPAPQVATTARRGGKGGTAAPSTFGRIPISEPDDIFPYDDDSSLTKVEVLFFDLDGTVLNWHGAVTDELRRQANKTNVAKIKAINWETFAFKWRDLFLATLRGLAAHGDTPTRSGVYRSALDELIGKHEKQLNARWTPAVRNGLVEIWDRVEAWPDIKDLQVIKGIKTLSTLSNITLREQTQINKRAGLSWDVCLSTKLSSAHLPLPEAYAAAAESMSLPVANCALVSARSEDLRAAARAGMKTIYARRASEDRDVEGEVLSKLEGGEFDLVVGSFQHLALVLGCDVD
ncbi:HAD-like domain-containing protein [Mycena filopes]|nr:HAD-like domain-containing protein [Mycena filopes]